MLYYIVNVVYLYCNHQKIHYTPFLIKNRVASLKSNFKPIKKNSMGNGELKKVLKKNNIKASSRIPACANRLQCSLPRYRSVQHFHYQLSPTPSVYYSHSFRRQFHWSHSIRFPSPQLPHLQELSYQYLTPYPVL